MKRAIIILAIFFVFTSCATRAEMRSRGTVEQIPLVAKDFTVVDMIVVQSTAVVDGDGAILAGSRVTYSMLLQEARRIGADDIANLRIDETVMSVSVDGAEPTQGGPASQLRRLTVTYTATALAIKYIP